MELRDFLNFIDNRLEFELYLTSRIGIFTTEDDGLKHYLEYAIEKISIEDKRLVIIIE